MILIDIVRLLNSYAEIVLLLLMKTNKKLYSFKAKSAY